MKLPPKYQVIQRAAAVWRWATCFKVALMFLTIHAVTASQFSIEPYVFSSGGSSSSNDRYSVTGTIGQVDAGETLTGDTFSIAGGFWNLLQVTDKNSALITISSLTHEYDGYPKAVSVTTFPSGLEVKLTYKGNLNPPSNAGTYEVIASIADATYNGTATATLVITKKQAEVALENLSLIYDGEKRTVGAVTIPNGLAVRFAYNGSFESPRNAGVYSVVGTVSDTNYKGSVTNILVINKATTPILFSNLNQTYNGAARIPTAKVVPYGLAIVFSYNGSAQPPVNAGTYKVVGNIEDVNYSGSETNTLVIGKATPLVNWVNTLQSYDGSPKVIQVATTPANLQISLTYNGSSIAPVNAGTYTVLGSVSDTNYKGTFISSLIINKGAVTLEMVNLNQTFDGTGKVVNVTTSPGNLPLSITYDGAVQAPTIVGSYTVVATASSANYFGRSTNVLTIHKGLASVSLTNLAQTYDGLEKAVKATTTPGNLPVKITYNGLDKAPVNAGKYPVVGSVTSSSYEGEVSSFLIISKSEAVINFASLAQTYNGSGKAVKATTVPEGLPVALTYNGLYSPPTNAGIYKIVATVEHANYSAIKTNVLTIGAVPVYITRQPVSTVVELDKPTSITVNHGGSPPFSYQWIKDGSILKGQTNRSVAFTPLQFTDIGTYNLMISNPKGMVLSLPARLSATNAPLHAWGSNNKGQSGGNTQNNINAPTSLITNVVAAGVGGSHSLILKGDGRLFSLGNNSNGQLGDGTTTSSSVPLYVGSNVIAVATGQNHSMYVKSDGSLWMMGLNDSGQLGNGHNDMITKPVSVASNVVAIAAGQNHSLFVKSDGTLWTMGLNTYGQLGRGIIPSTNRPISIMTNVVSVAAGNSHSLFIRAGGSLFAMGLNSSGQLGNGSKVNATRPTVVTNNVVSVAAGESHTVFVKADRSLWAMGGNGMGQLGKGLHTGSSLPLPIDVNALAVTAGTSHSVFIKTDGTMWAMGNNEFGQLGMGSFLASDKPTLVQGTGLVGAVLAKGSTANHSVAIATTNAVVRPPDNPPSGLSSAGLNSFDVEEIQLDNPEFLEIDAFSIVQGSPVLKLLFESDKVRIICSPEAAGFKLEYSKSLGSTAEWMPVTGISNPLVGACEIWIFPNSGMLFYRLSN